jgi:signal transduction histidine kinase
MLKLQSEKAAQLRRLTNPQQDLSKRLLIVDDDTALLVILRNLFTPYYNVQAAASGAEGLDVIRGGFIPQVIIADQRMPGMSGAKFLAQSRELLPSAVRMILTGYTDVEDIIESINVGQVYRFVTKPWNDQDLLETVRLCFEYHDLAEENSELTKALQRVTHLNEEKNQLMNIVAHDLKNPLSAILGYASVMQDTSMNLTSEEYRQFSQMISRSGDIMMQMITQLLEANALEENKITVIFVRLDVAERVRQQIEIHKQLAAQKNITLRYEGVHSAFIIVDEMMIRQVIDNLLSNAIKYSPHETTITIRLYNDEHFTYLAVQDQGPGIAPDEQSKLFGKFVKLSSRPTGGESSTGLGLFIVKTMLEKLHGTIRCESQLGKGTTFTVQLRNTPDVSSDASSDVLDSSAHLSSSSQKQSLQST